MECEKITVQLHIACETATKPFLCLFTPSGMSQKFCEGKYLENFTHSDDIVMGTVSWVGKR